MANAECRACPGNSEGTVSGLTVCPCVDGYYRAEGEEDRECTRKLNTQLLLSSLILIYTHRSSLGTKKPDGCIHHQHYHQFELGSS